MTYDLCTLIQSKSRLRTYMESHSRENFLAKGLVRRPGLCLRDFVQPRSQGKDDDSNLLTYQIYSPPPYLQPLIEKLYSLLQHMWVVINRENISMYSGFKSYTNWAQYICIYWILFLLSLLEQMYCVTDFAWRLSLIIKHRVLFKLIIFHHYQTDNHWTNHLLVHVSSQSIYKHQYVEHW